MRLQLPLIRMRATYSDYCSPSSWLLLDPSYMYILLSVVQANEGGERRGGDMPCSLARPRRGFSCWSFFRCPYLSAVDRMSKTFPRSFIVIAVTPAFAACSDAEQPTKRSTPAICQPGDQTVNLSANSALCAFTYLPVSSCYLSHPFAAIRGCSGPCSLELQPRQTISGPIITHLASQFSPSTLTYQTPPPHHQQRQR